MSATVKKAKELYFSCFSTDEVEAELILDFAYRHGQISFLKQEGREAGMICTCGLEDGDFSALYVFAACVEKKFRGRGLFRELLHETTRDRAAVLIPQTQELFLMYGHLGFLPIFHLETVIDGGGEAVPFEGTPEELYRIYQSSDCFPKKSRPLFEASVSAFLHYGGRVMAVGGTVFLLNEGRVSEVFAKDPYEAVACLKKGVGMGVKAMFPLRYGQALTKMGLEYEKNAIAMCKDIDCSKIYINNLFN